ncbi:flagellar basal-body rod protein FlgG [Kangiella sp. HZ709]|uniref:flagellar basal-body rod protein FlgG n=1 Tax=Kangiella sp. HZ709 TaxID=2666328 RepID=UPI0012B10970|nr:flagellar basal-body rod protein FlgG [Kangiella sp. HZ709]MRX26857.1 flagellar basal-body rod protein FlgG [Kangiella sp. HZ709]
MIDALYIAESGLNAQETLINVISNNIANSNTLGFKKNRVDFVDLVYKNNNTNTVSNDNTGNLVGTGTSIGSTNKVFTVGEIKATNNPLDVAILGQGFLEVELPSGQNAYTRAGRLMINNDGYLTTTHGYKLSSNIVVSPDVTNVIIGQDGQITGFSNNGDEAINLGQLDIAKFSSAESLKELGNNLYGSTDKSGEAIFGKPSEDGFGSLLQGHTEISNVSMVEEMVNLVLAQRGYQLNARVLQISDQMLETINNLRR